VFARNKQGERRLSPRVYKDLLTAHIIVSGAWLGVVVARLALGLAAVASNTPTIAEARYSALDALYVAFPPLAVGTVVTGVLLSLGTKWGLLRHYWVATKLVLTVAVIATAAPLADRFVEQSIAASSGQAAAGGSSLGFTSAPTMLITLFVVHMLMLGTTTVISVYKPWGKTWFGRRSAARPSQRGRRGDERRGAADEPAKTAPQSASS
jgi:hypothetical protein